MTKTPIPTVWEVPEPIRKRLGTKAGRQRAMFHDGHLLLILHLVPEPDKPERTGVFFWRKPDGEWKTSLAGAGVPALDQLLDEYAERIDALEERVLEAGAAVDYFEGLHAGTPVHRAAKDLKVALQSAREQVPDDQRIISLRDRAVDNELAAELLLENAQHCLDYASAKEAEEQNDLAVQLNRSTQRLNLLAALFLPLTAIGGLMGMNVKTGLEGVESVIPFWGLTAFSLLVGFVVRGVISK